MDQTITIPNLQSPNKAVKELLSLSKGYYCFAFIGDLGAGKTTFIKAICRQLGSEDEISSPTYALVNQYNASGATADGRTLIYHIDLYRLKTPEEAEDMGLDDYLADRDAWVFIEWPEIAGNLLPDKIVRIFIYRNEDDSRTLRISIP